MEMSEREMKDRETKEWEEKEWEITDEIWKNKRGRSESVRKRIQEWEVN